MDPVGARNLTGLFPVVLISPSRLRSTIGLQGVGIKGDQPPRIDQCRSVVHNIEPIGLGRSSSSFLRLQMNRFQDHRLQSCSCLDQRCFFNQPIEVLPATRPMCRANRLTFDLIIPVGNGIKFCLETSVTRFDFRQLVAFLLHLALRIVLTAVGRHRVSVAWGFVGQAMA